MTPNVYQGLTADSQATLPRRDDSSPGELALGRGEHLDPVLTQLASRYMETLLQGDRRAASAMILEAVDQGTPVRSVYLDVFQPVQRKIGNLWQRNVITVAVCRRPPQ